MTAEAQTLRLQIPAPEKIREYLDGFPDLARLVPEVCAALRTEFGDQADLSLEMYDDAEIEDRYLTLYVRMPRYDRGIIERIDRACSAFEGRLASTPGQILVTTDFRPSRGNDAI